MGSLAGPHPLGCGPGYYPNLGNISDNNGNNTDNNCKVFDNNMCVYVMVSCTTGLFPSGNRPGGPDRMVNIVVVILFIQLFTYSLFLLFVFCLLMEVSVVLSAPRSFLLFIRLDDLLFSIITASVTCLM